MLDSIGRSILTYLDKNGMSTIKTISEDLNISHVIIKSNINALKKDNYVSVDGKVVLTGINELNRYFITPNGKAKIEAEHKLYADMMWTRGIAIAALIISFIALLKS